MDYYHKYKLKKVINASGKMSILGVSKYSDPAIEAQKFGSQHFFEMEDLVLNTGKHIANLLEVESAYVVASASAGIAQAVSGIIGRGSSAHLYDPYSYEVSKREIILPKGHNVDYGTPIELMIKMGGGRVVEAGYANMCESNHMQDKVTKETAAILYVKSHHTVQKNMISIESALKLARENNIPLILDAAAEEDLIKYGSLGVDVIIFSGAKAIEGPSSGLVIGKKQYLDWIRMQSKGIGRAMKIGKENILGLTEAIEYFVQNGTESGESMKQRLLPFIDDLNKVANIKAKMIQDVAGREIYRAEIQIDENSPMTASKLIERLKENDPAIYTREYKKNMGRFELDIRALDKDEMQIIVKQFKEVLEKS